MLRKLMEGKYELHQNEIGSVYVSRNGHAAKLVIKHLEREGWGFKQIRSSSKEMEKEKKLGLDKDENHVEPLQPPRSIPTQHQSLRLNKTTN
jgi:hypothetical protein